MLHKMRGHNKLGVLKCEELPIMWGHIRTGLRGQIRIDQRGHIRTDGLQGPAMSVAKTSFNF